MDKKIYRVAIIGTGMIANAAHIPAWKDLKGDVELVGVADNRPDAAEETAARHQIPHWYADPQAMLVRVKTRHRFSMHAKRLSYAMDLAALRGGRPCPVRKTHHHAAG